MRLTILQLVVLGALLVAAMTVATIMVMRADRREQRTTRRLTLAVSPYARMTAMAVMGRREVTRSLLARLGQSLSGLFGYNPARAAQLPWPVGAVLAVASIGGLGACLLLSLLLGSGVLVGVPVASVILSRVLLGWFARRRSAKLYAQFPDTLAMIVRSVRIGIPVSEALRTVSREGPEPTAIEFRHLADQVGIGIPLEDALREVAVHSGLPEYRFFATALSLQAQTGGGLTETLENLADVIRKRVAMRARARALASEARTSSYILAALPVVLGVVLSFVNPSYISLLFTNAMGNKVLALAVTMLLLGVTAMQVTISRSLR